MTVSATVFDRACEWLEAETPLTRLEARGTVRLALREAGLEPRSVTAAQLRVVVERVLQRDLEALRIQDAESICRRLIAALATEAMPANAAKESPESIFHRLGGD